MGQEIISHDRRITNIILDYWDNMRGLDLFPSIEDVNPDHLKSIWGHCFIAQIVHDSHGTSYHYSYLGQHIVDAYGQDLTGESVDSLVSPDPTNISKSFEKVIETKTFLIDEDEFTNKNGKHIMYRQCLVPIGVGDSIDHILGGMRFKVD